MSLEKGYAVLRAWGHSRYIGGAEETYPECIGVFWWRLGWVEKCVVTCNESEHGKCLLLSAWLRDCHITGLSETARTCKL